MYSPVRTTIDSSQSTVVMIANSGAFSSELAAAIQAVHLDVSVVSPQDISKFLVYQENRVLLQTCYTCIWIDLPLFSKSGQKEQEKERVISALQKTLRAPLLFVSFDSSYCRKTGRKDDIPTIVSSRTFSHVLKAFPSAQNFSYQHVMYPYDGGASVISRFILEKIAQGKKFPFIGSFKPLWYTDVITHIVAALYDLSLSGGLFEGQHEISLEQFEKDLRINSHKRSLSGDPVEFPFEFKQGTAIGKTPYQGMISEMSLLVTEPEFDEISQRKGTQPIFVKQPSKKKIKKSSNRRKKIQKILITIATISVGLYVLTVMTFFSLLADLRHSFSKKLQTVSFQNWDDNYVRELSLKSTMAYQISRFCPLPFSLVGIDLGSEGVTEGLRSLQQFSRAMEKYHEGNALLLEKVTGLSQSSGSNSVKTQAILSSYDEGYKDLSSIQAEIANGNPIFDSLFGIDGLSSQLELFSETAREILTQEKAITSFIESIAERPGKSTVVFVLMDSQKARPLFGVPTDVFVLTLDQGKLLTTQRYTAQELDQMLKGKVDVPPEMQMHGAGDEWKFSDGAWSADGPTASRQLAWFLSKQLHVEADTVLFLKSDALPQFTSHLSGKSAETSILGIQTEDHSTESNADDGLSTFVAALNSSQAIVFSRDAGLAKTAKALAWDGSIRTPSCPSQFTVGKNCIVLTRYVAEYDLDEQKSPSEPVRIANQIHKMNISRDGIVHTDSILYDKSSKNLKKLLKYYVDQDAVLTAIAINGKLLPLEGISVATEFDKKTFVIPVYFNPDEQQSISVSYTTRSIDQKGSALAFFAQKSVGKGPDPFTLEVSFSREFIPTIVAPKAEYDRSVMTFSTELDSSKIFAIGF